MSERRAAALLRPATERLDALVGGSARRHVIVVLACVLGLDSSDKATVGTNATQLEQGLHIGDTQIGLLLAVSSLVGAVATVPLGALVDRSNRTRVLSFAIIAWAVAMALSGCSTGFVFLLITRMALGAVTAIAGPAVASLIGDYFPERERGRIYGFVLSGELVGAGFGFLVAGQFANLSWRAPFFVLVVPTLGVWWLVHRLPEPARDGDGRLPVGADDLEDHPPADSGTDGDEPRDDDTLAHRVVRDGDVQPRKEAVLTAEPQDMSLRQAVRYVLSVRTNVVLIISSALGYFFFSGLRGFAVEFAKKHYGIGQGLATTLTLVIGVGALAGVLLGGRLADRLLRRGLIPARVVLPGVAVLLAGVLFAPAIAVASVVVAVPLLLLAALCLGAANPPLDAARLDIIHPRMWGRAEAVRTVLRSCGDAAAPLLFGVLSESVFGGRDGLEYTFLIMLVTLFAGAAVDLLIARRTYPADVAAAAESRSSTPTASG